MTDREIRLESARLWIDFLNHVNDNFAKSGQAPWVPEIEKIMVGATHIEKYILTGETVEQEAS